MRAEVRETAPLERALDIRLDEAEVRSFIDQMVDAFRRRHTLPGFRPGKAPPEVILSRFHQDIDQAVVSELVPDSIQKAMAEHGIRPAAPGRISDLSYEPKKPLTFTVTIEIWPAFELKDYEGMEVDQLIEEVDESDVDKQIDWIRDQMAQVSPVERAAEAGDLVDAELESVDEQGTPLPGTQKETTRLEAGAQNLLPEFREASLGISQGETRDLAVTYPEDFNNDDLKGQTRRYRLTANQIAEKKLPAVDDEFAQRLEPSLDVAGLRAKVRLRLESERRLASQERLEQSIVDRLLRENSFDIPDGSVRTALDRLGERLKDEGREADPQELEKVYRPHIERAHRRDLILAKVGEREEISVGSREVEDEVKRIAQQEKRQVEEVKKDIGDLNRFRDFLFERRVLEALRGKIRIREVNVPSAVKAGVVEQGASPGSPEGAQE